MMPRYTEAYSKFIVRLEEVKNLLQIARQTARRSPTPSNISLINALCRSGVVMLSSHIEGYVEDLGEIALDRISQRQVPKNQLSDGFRYYLSRDLINQIKQTTEPSQIAITLDSLLRRDNHIWNTIPNFVHPLSVEIFLGNFANPSHKRIKKFFGRFGYSQYQQDLQRRLGANYVSCSNMIDQVVDQRNKIAHGDTVTTGTPYDLANMITLVKQYCREVDCVVGDWFRTKGCPIR